MKASNLISAHICVVLINYSLVHIVDLLLHDASWRSTFNVRDLIYTVEEKFENIIFILIIRVFSKLFLGITCCNLGKITGWL